MDDFLPQLPESDLLPVDPIYALSLANHLVSLYTNKLITDISVKCGEETFDLHSPILSHGSGYFQRVLFDEQSEISLEFTPEIEASTFRIIIESLYTGSVDNMREDNVTAILKASHHMEVHHVTKACTEYMLKHMDLDNCLEFWLSARLCGNEKVKGAAIGLIGRHLEKISQSSDYLGLQSNTVIEILSDDKLQVSSEIKVYEAAIAWLKHDPDSREGELSSILDAIRLPLLPVKYLVNVVGKEDMIEENSDAMKKYSKALKTQLGGKDDSIRPRHNFMYEIVSGYEKAAKSVRMRGAKPKESAIESDIEPSSEEMPSETLNETPNSRVGGLFSNCAKADKETDEKDDVSSAVQSESRSGMIASIGGSFKKIGEYVTNPETYSNLDKRSVGGFWLNVSPLPEVQVNGEETTKDGDKAKDEETAKDEKGDSFDLSRDDEDDLQQSFSLTEHLEDVPEVDEEEDLSDAPETNLLDMENLSMETDKKVGEVDVDESKLGGEDLLDLLDGDPIEDELISKNDVEDDDSEDDSGDFMSFNV